MAGNTETVIELDRRRIKATVEKDIPTLSGLLSDELIYTHSSARVDTKQSLIDGIVSGATTYTSLEPSEVVAQDFGSAVVLTGIAAIGVSLNGQPTSFRVRFTDVYANTRGSWQMVAWHSTKLQ
jgi:hypothetical protein